MFTTFNGNRRYAEDPIVFPVIGRFGESEFNHYIRRLQDDLRARFALE